MYLLKKILNGKNCRTSPLFEVLKASSTFRYDMFNGDPVFSSFDQFHKDLMKGEFLVELHFRHDYRQKVLRDKENVLIG